MIFNIFKKKPKEKNNQNQKGYTTNIIQKGEEHINRLLNDEDYSTLSLDVIRSISRERARTNPIIGAYARLGENNVVGKGFGLKINKKQNFPFTKKQEEQILHEWNLFSNNKENFDSSGKLNLKEFCRILTRGLLIDGENLVKIIREEAPTKDSPFGLQFQMLDVNRINTDLNGENITKGVEFNQRGKAVKFHLRKTVLSNFGLKTKNTVADKVEKAEDVIYLANFIASEQTRGTPYTATALSPVKTLEVFDKITLKAAQIGTLLSVYIKKDLGSRDINELDKKNNDISLSSGGIYELQPGESIEGFKGEYPVELYNKFVDKKINQIARALGLSSTFLANEISSANYAIARFMSNEDREFYQTIQQKIIDNFLNIVFKEFLQVLVFHKGFNPKILKLEFSFVASNFEEIDAVKTQAAKNAELKSFRKSFTRLANENNDDFNDVVEEFNSDFETMSKTFNIDKAKLIEYFLNKSFQ